MSGKVVLTPLQLAVMERKREVASSLLSCLTSDQLVEAVTARILILEDKASNKHTVCTYSK